MDPTRRFSSRVENYVRYRPRYPRQVLDTLAGECGLAPHSVVADVGSGTGFLTELFLQNGNRVFGVEPNPDMRQAGERLLRDYPAFTSVDGAAEATTLADHSVDFVVAGQAFHWFDAARARAEFLRILKPGGWVALVWNDRKTEGTTFLAAYERLLKTCSTDYEQVNHRHVGEDDFGAFFGGPFRQASFPSRQVFDFDGLRGRLMSSSYAPEAGHPSHEPMLDDLRALFEAHQAGGTVAFEYDTLLYYGRLAGSAAPAENP